LLLLYINTHTYIYTGGAVYTEYSFKIKHCDFYNNSAITGSGGAVRFSGLELLLKNSVLVSNTAAAADGGAVASAPTTTLRLKNTTLLSNFAVNGGALSIQDKLRSRNSTYTRNTALIRGGAVVSGASSELDIQNSNFTSNACEGTHSSHHCASTACSCSDVC
jgi:hypothetical protein